MFSRFFAGVLCLLSLSAQAEVIQDSYAFSILGEPKYVSNFTSFDYVNPAAPKGGQITLAAIGTYDNFNRFASRGNPAVRSGSLYDSLFTTSSDEIGRYYPLIAASARYDSQYRWVEVALTPRARFNDHTPITARHVAFSFRQLLTDG